MGPRCPHARADDLGIRPRDAPSLPIYFYWPITVARFKAPHHEPGHDRSGGRAKRSSASLLINRGQFPSP